MTFHSLRDEIFQKNHENAAYFAETVEMAPPGSGVYVSVEGVHIRATGQGETQEFVQEGTEQLLVRFPSNVTLQRGHQLRRAAATDPDRRPFCWTGEFTEHRAHKKVAIFERDTLLRQGARS